MSQAQPYAIPVASLDEETRADFMVKVYQHLVAAIVAFVAFETLLFATGAAEGLFNLVYGRGGAWLLVLGGFMVVNWLATAAAHDLANPGRQYAGLFALAGAEALIFAPFLYYVFNEGGGGTTTVASAAAITAVAFAGLTVVGLVTRRDLSFMRPLLMWAGVMSLVLIFAAVVFGLELGVWFTLAMIALAGGAIIYQTQTIMRHYPPEAYVGASIQLFASVMLLFWYVLRLLSRR
ncbi:MAG: Bax inhibitor-1/YccA family protein [Acidimicrobiales bacterium]|nr:Bax inhibitor-1/YccA family protein [Acidimicrobiales bacterium]MCB1017752.1 Bax inhibitor-1/YccA family protein [Acidimicrobiales bacterium]MCB9374160.1 Bax inhibitor-1 family protein [Microthrixaceae bacterium]